MPAAAPDRDPRPSRRKAAMNLAQGGRRHRLGSKLGEGLREPDAELGADDGLHFP